MNKNWFERFVESAWFIPTLLIIIVGAYAFVGWVN